MHSNATEILAKPRLEIPSRYCIERLAWRAQHIVDNRRRCGLSRVGGRDAICLQALRRGHSHHLLGDSICFLLEFVFRIVYLQLTLD